jgi:uncharacterized protein YbjT (DUF2867 family)
MMHVAIIGGTGFVGSYLVDELRENGHQVSLLVRKGSEYKVDRDDLHRIVAGDISSADALQDLFADCDAVIYCIGILREKRRQGITFEALQYEGLAATVEAATGAGVGRLLLMSANGVKIPGTAYQETKIRAEKVALTSDLESTVFRPSVIFGEPRGKMEFASQLFRDMVAMPFPALGFFTGLSPAKGPVLMSPIHVRDVARAFCRSLEDSDTYGRVYELGGPEVLSWVQIIRRIADAADRKKWILPFPLLIMKLSAWFFDWLPFFPATRDQLTMLAEGNVADSKIVASLIGESPRAFSVENLRYLNRTMT